MQRPNNPWHVTAFSGGHADSPVAKLSAKKRPQHEGCKCRDRVHIPRSTPMTVGTEQAIN